MRKVTIKRQESSHEGTFGKCSTDSGFECYTAELPDKNNEVGKSCIPKGTYKCTWRESPKHGMCYHIEKVEGRTNVEIHKGNFAGDIDKGFKSDILGCILLGNAIGDLAGQKALLSSTDAITRFVADLEQKDFELTIS